MGAETILLKKHRHPHVAIYSACVAHAAQEVGTSWCAALVEYSSRGPRPAAFKGFQLLVRNLWHTGNKFFSSYDSG